MTHNRRKLAVARGDANSALRQEIVLDPRRADRRL